VDHPGRIAAVVAIGAAGERTRVGRVGELHPRMLQAYEVRAEHVTFAELHLDVVATLVPSRIRVGPLEHLPGVERDIAVVVAADRAAGDVEAIIHEQGGPDLRSVRLFDIYRGAPLEEGQTSLAYRLRFESIDADLSDGSVESSVERVVKVLSERLGAHLRA
jgi:phenylalanyl-tRNA synthetase beta chain